MTKVQLFSGIDVSKKTFDVSIENGQVQLKTHKMAYTEEGMADYVAMLPQGVHCIMESTGTYHCRLAWYLHERGIKVSVVNPLAVKRYAQALMIRSKTDKSDSRLLVAYGKHFDVPLWEPKASHYIELQQLLKFQDQLLKSETIILNQLEALTHSVVQNATVSSTQNDRLKEVREDLKEIEKAMQVLVNEYEKENYNLLKAIPGIGKKTAIALIALTSGMKNFESSKQVCSYFGLSPRIYESGTSVKGKAKICKMGMAQIRKLLYMCALSAKKCNKACHELYDRLLNNGKKKKLALIAVANKLLKQAFSILKNKVKYEDNFYANKFGC